MIALSARLPAWLVLGLLLAIRRPRRAILTTLSLLITDVMIVCALALHSSFACGKSTDVMVSQPGLGNPLLARVDSMVLVVTVILVVLATIDTIFITQATVLDAQRPSALARAFGATTGQVSGGLTVAQLDPKGAHVTDIETQYSTGASRQAIEQALAAAGKDLDHLRPGDLALLEDFHTMGRIATAQLADLAGITPDDEVLDAGSGIGGTARYIAERSGCHVTAVDLTEEYCRTARWLNQLAGLDHLIAVRQADVTDLPFEDAAFTLMFSQHVQMNVAGKALLYGEARRVLADGGLLAVWDIVAGEGGEPGFPVPWADRPEYSHLTTPGRLRAAIATAGFEIEQWNDLTGQAAAMMQTLLTLPPSPIGLQAFVPDFESKPRTSPPRWQTAGCAPSRASHERSETSGRAAAARRGQGQTSAPPTTWWCSTFG